MRQSFFILISLAITNSASTQSLELTGKVNWLYGDTPGFQRFAYQSSFGLNVDLIISSEIEFLKIGLGGCFSLYGGARDYAVYTPPPRLKEGIRE
ncbi:MAG: hypothetical protein KKF20_00955 [Bacteroidetes bacterium]|nr:hypothetical protein [Bacteroidota bacterium]MBU1423374.1 hypothetical protein [Bacteroidota bacterium]MBU2470961.1 hypothetical protein [Bacteroidota bacterium]MBU2636943.1 hypothetical protein [Bacteroidota bacterium]